MPEVASRRHLELVTPVIREALAEAGATLADVDRIAVTQGPGLIGALLVGLAAAKAIAWSRRLPLVPVDHLDGHVASLYLQPDPLEPPFLCLLASGGHTMLLDVHSHTERELLGSTLDDAAGEAFDKGARLLGLGYPGGREIDRLAGEGDPNACDFPVARVPGLDGVVQTSRGANDWHRAIFQAIDLVQPAGLILRGHEEHVCARFNLVRNGIVISNLHRNLLWKLLLHAQEHLFIFLVASAQSHNNHVLARQPVHDLRDQIKTFLGREARDNTDHR